MSKASDALNELEKAAEEFKSAIFEFKEVHDPETVGLMEWIEDIDGVMYDIESDIESSEEDE